MNYDCNGAVLWADAIAEAIGQELTPLIGYGSWISFVRFAPLNPDTKYTYLGPPTYGSRPDTVTRDGCRVLVGNREIQVMLLPGEPGAEPRYDNRTGRTSDPSLGRWRIHLLGQSEHAGWGRKGRKERIISKKTFSGAVRATVMLMFDAVEKQEIGKRGELVKRPRVRPSPAVLEERRREKLRRKTGG